MYGEIHQLKRMGLNKSQTAGYLGINVKTVSKYWDIDADGFEKKRQKNRSRKKKLSGGQNSSAKRGRFSSAVDRRRLPDDRHDVLSRAQFDSGVPKTVLGVMMRDLGVNSLSELSPMIPPGRKPAQQILSGRSAFGPATQRLLVRLHGQA